ncbi:Teichoic acid translocation permease protein TagG [Polystyrenella longa]|uniref:Transport permease protein n=1 Tax=Polystyrenella longa TaxID=2528007 RepID=A0A518CJ29_9PLAN|nr:ABC transporter permease [Polystyrenella longa]QDU79197.1 Teichoic acid translocation permease protein TagG [Polystyrenella longa]
MSDSPEQTLAPGTNETGNRDEAPRHRIEIKPSSRWGLPDGGELWRYRELLWMLILRDLKVRYKQTVLGLLWTIIQPLALMTIFTLFLGRYIQPADSSVPYYLFVLTGLVMWQFFARSLTDASTSLVVNERVVTKVYFPRILVPTSVILAGLPDFLIASLILGCFLIGSGLWPGLLILFAPLFVILTFVAAMGVGLWLSALDVNYRDVRYTLSFLTQLWMFASPIVYPAEAVQEKWGLPGTVLYGMNPIAGAIEGFRWTIFTDGPFPMALVVMSSLVTCLLFISGMYYFQQMQRTLADHL